MLFLRLKLTKPDKRCKRFRASGLCNIRGVTLIDGDYVRLGSACHCGKELKLLTGRGRPPKFCEDHKAKPQKEARPAKECPACRGFFTPVRDKQEFCNNKICRNRARTLRENPESKRREKIDRTCTCKKCGIHYKNKRGGTVGEGSQYCSRECAYADISQWRAKDIGGRNSGWRKYPDAPGPHCNVFFKVCSWCGNTFTTRWAKQETCSNSCQYSDQLKKRRDKYECVPETVKQCSTCGLSFNTNKASSRYCSIKCVPKLGNHRKRARHAGVAYEPVNTVRVLERDGWKCQICGKSTPRERRGSRYSNAPELDHRVPFALGGPHTYDNVQCACRACNAKKGGTVIVGQLPLFA